LQRLRANAKTLREYSSTNVRHDDASPRAALASKLDSAAKGCISLGEFFGSANEIILATGLTLDAGLVLQEIRPQSQIAFGVDSDRRILWDYAGLVLRDSSVYGRSRSG